MKKLYMIVYILLMICLSSLVFAIGNDSLVAYYNFDDNINDQLNSIYNLYAFGGGGDGSTAGYEPVAVTANYTAVGCMVGSCVNMIGGNYWLNLSTTSFSNNLTGNYTIILWVYGDVTSSRAYWEVDDGSNSHYSYVYDLSATPYLYYNSPFGSMEGGNGNVPYHNWAMITLKRTDTQITLWQNKSIIWENTTKNYPFTSDMLQYFYVNYRHTGLPATGYIGKNKYDEMSIWARSLNDVEIQDIYDMNVAGISLSSMFGDTTPPTITFNKGNNFSDDNSTILSPFLVNLSLNITVSDINLNIVRVNISSKDGNTKYSYINTSITTGSVKLISFINITDWPLGNYTVKVYSYDGTYTTVKDSIFRLGAVVNVSVYSSVDYSMQNASIRIGNQNTTSMSSGMKGQLVNITLEMFNYIINLTEYTNTKQYYATQYYQNISFNVSQSNIISFKIYDEYSNTLIQNEQFSIYLEGDSYSQYFNSSSSSFSINNLPSGTYTAKIYSTYYPIREYKNIISSNESTTILQAYLINSTMGQSVKFTVRGQSISPIENVNVIFQRFINGTWRTVDEEYTDYDGSLTLYVDSNYQYKINLTKTGYTPMNINLEPSNTLYIISMEGLGYVTNLSYSTGISYRMFPSDDMLTNGTDYPFLFTLNSYYWDIIGCSFYIYNDSNSGALINSVSGVISPRLCNLSIIYNTGTTQNIKTVGVVQYTGMVQNQTYYTIHKIPYSYVGQFSLKNFLDDITNFSASGFGMFTRMIIALIVMLSVIGLISKYVGFASIEITLIPLLLMVWAFSFIGWIYIGDYSAIPEAATLGFNMRKYIIAILVSLLTVGFIADKYVR